MQLFATRRSHFSRKVRLLLDPLNLPYALIDVGNVAESSLSNFCDNPLMSVPVLQDGENWVIDSDHISGYIVRRYDEADQYGFYTQNVHLLNARSVMNGIMTNEVKLILSSRTGLDSLQHSYFQKAKQTIDNGLLWLEENSDILVPESPTYTEFHFISMWDHLELYDLTHFDYPALHNIADVLRGRGTVSCSAPTDYS